MAKAADRLTDVVRKSGFWGEAISDSDIQEMLARVTYLNNIPGALTLFRFPPVFKSVFSLSGCGYGDQDMVELIAGLFKGSLTRDFRRQVFFINQFSPGPLSISLGPFKFLTKIRRYLQLCFYRRCRLHRPVVLMLPAINC